MKFLQDKSKLMTVLHVDKQGYNKFTKRISCREPNTTNSTSILPLRKIVTNRSQNKVQFKRTKSKLRRPNRIVIPKQSSAGIRARLTTMNRSSRIQKTLSSVRRNLSVGEKRSITKPNADFSQRIKDYYNTVEVDSEKSPKNRRFRQNSQFASMSSKTRARRFRDKQQSVDIVQENHAYSVNRSMLKTTSNPIRQKLANSQSALNNKSKVQ